MDYQKMWYMLKKRMSGAARNQGLEETKRSAARTCLDAMDDIEILLSEKPVTEEKEPKTVKAEDVSGDRKQKKDIEGKCILKEILGEDLVSDVKTLEAKMKGSKDTVIMVDGDMVIPEHLKREASERNIALARAYCKSMPFPFPFPPGFIK